MHRWLLIYRDSSSIWLPISSTPLDEAAGDACVATHEVINLIVKLIWLGSLLQTGINLGWACVSELLGYNVFLGISL